MNDTWLWIMQVAVMLVTIGGGGGVVYWLVGLVKERFGTEGYVTVAVVVAMSVLMAVAGLVVDGQISAETLRPGNAAAIVVLVFTMSQQWLRWLNGGRGVS